MFDDAVCAVAELAASQHGVFTRRQAADLTPFDRSRLANALPAAGSASTTPASMCRRRAHTWHQWLKAATLTAGGHAVARTARRPSARVRRVRRRRARRGQRVPRHRGATGRDHRPSRQRPRPRRRVKVDGIACTGLARTLVDLGSVCADPLVVRRALTDVRRRGTDLRWIQLTAERLTVPASGARAAAGPAGTIPHEGQVPDSWMEELLALCLADVDSGPSCRSTHLSGRRHRRRQDRHRAARRQTRAWRATAGGSTSAPMPSPSTSSAT